jgi:hypothetical protein
VARLASACPLYYCPAREQFSFFCIVCPRSPASYSAVCHGLLWGRQTIALVYLTTPSLFPFDAATSLPLSWVDYAVLQVTRWALIACQGRLIWGDWALG